MMNKKRLAALALSAVMAASTMSFPVYAADFSDGGNAQAKTFSAEVEVPAAEVTEETPDSVGVGDAFKVVPETIKFHYNEAGYEDFTVTFQRANVNDENDLMNDTAKATTLKHLDANCFHPGLLWMTVTIDGETYTSGDVEDYNQAFIVKDEPQREHKKYEVKRQTIKEATHFEEGEAHVWYACKYEDCDWKDDEYITLEVQDHTWGDWVYVADENVKEDDNGYVVFGEDGEPELIDEMKDGVYYKTRFCTVDNARDTKHEKRLIALAKKAAYAKIVKTENIATISENPAHEILNQVYDYPTVDLPIDEAEIELIDCSKEGSYVIEYYTIENNKISEEKITVAPHHYRTYVTAEFKTWDDMMQCDVVWEDGELKVTNNSCYLPVEYTAVTHCSAEGCPAEDHKIAVGKDKDGNDVYLEQPQLCIKADGKTTDGVIKTEVKTAEPAGAHVINTKAKDEVKKLVRDKKGRVLYSDLEAIAKVESNFVKISARPENNCEESGDVTVSFICVVDKTTVVETMTVRVIPTGHTRQPAVRENYVAPTCTSTGSYDAVVKCETCGKELERRKGVIIPRIKHTNEVSVAANGTSVDDEYTDTTAYIKFIGDKVVDFDGESLDKELLGKPLNTNKIGTYGKNEYSLYCYVYTNCTVCGRNEVKLADSRQDVVEITITDIKKQEESGKAGYITLKATYDQNDVVDGTVTAEITVPYFSTIEAYNGRLEETPDSTPDSKINGLHLDSDGVWRYYKDSVLQSDYTGFVDYAGRTFYVINGKLDQTLTRLIIFDNEWYYLIEGELTNYTGVVLYDGEWFYVSKGRLDDTINGLVEYNGGLFVFVEGRLADEGNGMWISNDNKAYWLALGRVCEEYTGVAMYNNAFFYVIDGKVAQDYNGTVEYNGATFRVENGQLYGPIK